MRRMRRQMKGPAQTGKSPDTRRFAGATRQNARRQLQRIDGGNDRGVAETTAAGGGEKKLLGACVMRQHDLSAQHRENLGEHIDQRRRAAQLVIGDAVNDD